MAPHFTLKALAWSGSPTRSGPVTLLFLFIVGLALAGLAFRLRPSGFYNHLAFNQHGLAVGAGLSCERFVMLGNLRARFQVGHNRVIASTNQVTHCGGVDVPQVQRIGLSLVVGHDGIYGTPKALGGGLRRLDAAKLAH